VVTVALAFLILIQVQQYFMQAAAVVLQTMVHLVVVETVAAVKVHQIAAQHQVLAQSILAVVVVEIIQHL
jgi:hypothetical protein